MIASMADSCALTSDALHAAARDATGLDDFGADDYRDRLDVYLGALADVDDMHACGRVNLFSQISQWLKNRLLLTDLLRRHPEIDDIDVAPPVVIAGLPRTGTTHLHNMLAAGPTFRTMPYWESAEPFPLPTERGVEPDPRLARMEMAVSVMDLLLPHFRAMHEMTSEHVHEEIQLLANDFSTMLMETLAHVPTWRDYYLAHDQTPHYEYLRTQLKAMQFLRGGRRWLLKSPQHLEQLPILQRVFPGVVVVCTHRDPVPVVVSMVAMVAYTARMYSAAPPVRTIAASWASRLEQMLAALVRDRDVLAPEQFADVRFDEFMTDEAAVAERVHELADEPMTAEARAAIQTYLASHQRNRFGRVSCTAAMFGLDEQELADRFRGYTQRFLA
ncbi:sulfotransferase [Mycolicibacterium sp. 018/SC-01/001]|uniref:sulfotransferase family protein n=1 Tax=Mycolicibacterium sp. 018/SC-01/001 TaxID=2592069 RepID=UPI00117E8FD1|nr:sulfotransferase [Mycolicibacterium sp. 018/SC-01/001]TRW77596.1 sulfotransferase [Mycolicibacterium sp. 018/SC-01/001]